MFWFICVFLYFYIHNLPIKNVFTEGNLIAQMHFGLSNFWVSFDAHDWYLRTKSE